MLYELESIIYKLPKRDVQAEINADFFRLLTQNSWAYDTIPQGLGKLPLTESNFDEMLPLRKITRDNYA